jgi:serine/threonine protein kinase
MMNREQIQYSENRILSIFTDICAAVNSMHSAALPIAHFDVKVSRKHLSLHDVVVFVCLRQSSSCSLSIHLCQSLRSQLENILHHETDVFKLCDFGSAMTTPIVANSTAERKKAEEWLNTNTTPVYRAPEMVDLYSGHKVWLPADIWALGILLHMLAFRRVPFEPSTAEHICNQDVMFVQPMFVFCQVCMWGMLGGMWA